MVRKRILVDIIITYVLLLVLEINVKNATVTATQSIIQSMILIILAMQTHICRFINASQGFLSWTNGGLRPPSNSPRPN